MSITYIHLRNNINYPEHFDIINRINTIISPIGTPEQPLLLFQDPLLPFPDVDVYL